MNNNERISEKIESILLDRYSIGEADYLHQMVFDDECTKEDVLSFMDYVSQCEKQDMECDIDKFSQLLQEVHEKRKSMKYVISCFALKANDKVYIVMNNAIYEGRVQAITYNYDCVSYLIKFAEIGLKTLAYGQDTTLKDDNTLYASIEDVANNKPLQLTEVNFEHLLQSYGYTTTAENGEKYAIVYCWSDGSFKPIIENFVINISLFVIWVFPNSYTIELDNDMLKGKTLYPSAIICMKEHKPIIYSLDE